MPTYIHLANLIINKSAIEQKVKGGCEAFRKHKIFTNLELNQEDNDVFSLTRMNPDEFDTGTLQEMGLDYNEKEDTSSDFTIVTRYGGVLWKVDWLEHNGIYAWHVNSSAEEINLAQEKSNMLMDEFIEIVERGENPCPVIRIN
jgi:hypothetical protein